MRRSIGALVLAGALTGLTAVLVPSSSPPLYDGLILGNEPYRYLNPPVGYQHTPAPTGQRLVLKLVGGQPPSFTVASTEQPAQAQVTGSAGLVVPPPGASSVIASIEPVSPPAPAPAGMVFDGNVYRFQILSTAGTALPFAAKQTVTAALRGTGARGTPVFAVWDGRSWHQLAAFSSGTPDTYAGINIPSAGWYALLVPIRGATTGSGSAAPAIGAVSGVLVLVVAVLVVVRRRRTHAPAAED